MSKFKVYKSNDDIEFDDLEVLEHDVGWHNGQWNNWDVILNSQNYDFYVIHKDTREFVKVNVGKCEIYETNNFNRFTNGFTSTRLKVTIPSVVGDVEVNYPNDSFYLYYMER